MWSEEIDREGNTTDMGHVPALLCIIVVNVQRAPRLMHRNAFFCSFISVPPPEKQKWGEQQVVGPSQMFGRRRTLPGWKMWRFLCEGPWGMGHAFAKDTPPPPSINPPGVYGI